MVNRAVTRQIRMVSALVKVLVDEGLGNLVSGVGSTVVALAL